MEDHAISILPDGYFQFLTRKHKKYKFFLWKVKKSSQKFVCFKRMPYICSA